MEIKKNFNLIDKCRISGSKLLYPLLHLGKQPLANSLKKSSDGLEDSFPLSIVYCEESSLVQLKETIDKDILFKDYIWVTSTSQVAKNYSKIFFDYIIKNTDLDKDDLIIEIASNDGTFIIPFKEKGFKKVIGIEPASNICEIATKNNIKTINSFWDLNTAKEIEIDYGKADLVFARNVIPHVSEIHEVMSGFANILKEEGIGVIEFHDAGVIQKELQYDSIYHEHLCYFSIQSMTYLLNLYGLNPYHIEKSPISGGSWVIFFSKSILQASKYFELEKANEIKLKVNSFENWRKFSNNSISHRDKLIKLVNSMDNKKIVGFGSSARSQTLINFCNFNVDNIDCIIDNNPLKQNLYAPGSSIPIVDLKTGLSSKPDAIFVLAWNFRNEIVNECKANGYNGKFIIPFPGNPQII